MRKTITAKNAPRPGGQYSHAIIANGFVYVSGQVPLDPATNSIPEGFAAQVRQTLRNLQTILEAAGASLKDVVKVNAYLGEAARFAEYNEIYKEFFAEGPPARTTIGCKLLVGQVEIDCIALLPE
ncbi:MAG: RidA family protein [Acetobacteraceae bacterium]